MNPAFDSLKRAPAKEEEDDNPPGAAPYTSGPLVIKPTPPPKPKP